MKQQLSIAIPASLVADVPHLREKTLKVGVIGRAAAIFRVDEIVVFKDLIGRNQLEDFHLIGTILSYIETPQYLRKRLFRVKPQLRYAGVLPPLRTPHHPLENLSKDLRDGEFREGVVESTSKDGALVDVGVERSLLIRKKRPRLNSRVTVRIERKGKLLEAHIVDRSTVPDYWGYKVALRRSSFRRFLKNHTCDLVIAASRHGSPLAEVLEDLKNRWQVSKKILVVFGSPEAGLYEIAKQENLNLDMTVDFVINTIPDQAVATVRTEEALLSTLAILNFVIGKG